MAAENCFCFGKVANEWLAFIEKERKHSTYVKYRKIMTKYLFWLAEYSVDDLDLNTVSKRLTVLTKEGGENLKRTVYSVLNQILKYANNHYNLKLNFMSNIPPLIKKKKIEILNQTEQAKLLRYLSKTTDIYKAGIILCLSTGLRLGEICSLKWTDIDMKMRILHVNSTVQRIEVDGHDTKTILMESGPKSIYSEREIPLPDDVVNLLTDVPQKGNYFLCATKPMEPRTYQNKLKSYLQSAGIQRKNFHALRHTFATNCINTGADIKSLSEILGHADVKITLNRYVHPTLDTKRQHLNNLTTFYGQILK